MALPNLNQHSALLFQIWEDSYQRVATQQEIYEGPWQQRSLLICMGAGEGPVRGWSATKGSHTPPCSCPVFWPYTCIWVGIQ